MTGPEPIADERVIRLLEEIRDLQREQGRRSADALRGQQDALGLPQTALRRHPRVRGGRARPRRRHAGAAGAQSAGALGLTALTDLPVRRMLCQVDSVARARAASETLASS